MADVDPFAAPEDDFPSFTDAPSAEESQSLTKLCSDYYENEREIARMEEELKERKKKRDEYEFKLLPDYMKQIGQDIVGLPEQNVDVVLKPYYYANIPVDWSEEKREEAYSYLESLGGGDLVKASIGVEFTKSQLDAALWLQNELPKIIRNGPYPSEEPDLQFAKKVHWSSLTSFLRNLTEKGEPVEWERLNGKAATRAQTKKRS